MLGLRKKKCWCFDIFTVIIIIVPLNFIVLPGLASHTVAVAQLHKCKNWGGVAGRRAGVPLNDYRESELQEAPGTS